jgi:hypothetical protein
MSKPPKAAKSGLKSVQRDWSSSSLKPSQEIHWSPSPPIRQASKQPLTGAQQRLKDIQDALSGKSVPSERRQAPSQSQPLVASKNLNKRPSPDLEIIEPSAKKARKLPASWKDNDPLTSATWGPSAPTSSRSAVQKPPVTSLPPTTATAGKAKVAAVFLSQEQNQILKLVQEGSSVFYTGSAGECGSCMRMRRILMHF